MKLNTRCLFLSIIATAIIIVGLQIINLSDSAYDGRHVSVRQHAKDLIQRGCSDAFPIKHSARIFSDGREIKHIAFLKVHKTASGTAASIFFRYGVTRGLTFVLPKHINSISSYYDISDNFIHPRLNKSFDIMTSHVIYNRTALKTYLYEDTVYVGILREPYLQFKSSMNYMSPKYVYNISDVDPIQQYLKQPQKYEPKNPRFSWINNRQSVEFGFPTSLIWSKNRTEIDKYIHKLDTEFHLVIIAEYFDESVVLMKRMFGWQMVDILYRKLHIRGWDRKITEPRPNDRKLYRDHASVDYVLYDFFFHRLFEQIKKAGEGFYEEVLHFKNIRVEMEDFCKSNLNTTMRYLIPFSEWNTPILLDAGLCKMIYSEEEDWVKLIKKKQYKL